MMESLEAARNKEKIPSGPVVQYKRAPSPDVQDSSRPEGTPCRTPQSNIFQHFAVFFACGEAPGGSNGTHVLSGTDDTVLLPILLRDIVQRKCSFSKLTQNLHSYCNNKDTQDFKSQVFLTAVIKVLPSVPQCEVVENLQALGQLVHHFSGSLEDLLSVICDMCDLSLGATSDHVLFRLLETTLQHAQTQEAVHKVCRNKALKNLRFIDKQFSFGETALVYAARRKNVQILRVLLRYGAEKTKKWLNFNHVLEVLLFAPHTVYLTTEDILMTTKCVDLVCAHMECCTEVMQALEEKHKCGYFPLCPQWRTILPPHFIESQAPTLRHMARKVIRDTLQNNGLLPAGIASLPLPTLIQDYLDYAL